MATMTATKNGNWVEMNDAPGEPWPDDAVVGLGPAPTVLAEGDPRPALTARQAEVVAAIHELTLAASRPPTIREIMTATGIGSPNGVFCHLRPLTRKGYLKSDPRTARGIVLLPPPAEWRGYAPCRF